MRIDANRVFGSTHAESRLLEVLEANIRDLILLNVLLSTSSEKNDLKISVCFRAALDEEQKLLCKRG